MQQFMLKAKLHRATVTGADLEYEGSLSIDSGLMRQVGLCEFERVHVYNINNGERFETYAIEAPAGSGTIGLNGAAARKGLQGDRVIIASYCLVDAREVENHVPKVALLDDENRIYTVIQRS